MFDLRLDLIIDSAALLIYSIIRHSTYSDHQLEVSLHRMNTGSMPIRFSGWVYMLGAVVFTVQFAGCKHRGF